MGRIGKTVTALAALLALGFGVYVVALELSAPPTVHLGPAITLEPSAVPAVPSSSSPDPSMSASPAAPSTKQSTGPAPTKGSSLPSKSAPVKPLPPRDDDDDDGDDDGDDDDD